jgi:O-antigen/teichoic acid export membrane protein
MPLPIEELELTEAVSRSESKPERFGATEHLQSDLKKRSIRGGVLVIAAQATKFVVQTLSTAILARLLVPSDFGIVGMVSAITGLLGSFGDLGLSSATIQRDEITHEQVSTLFWINVAFSLLISVTVAALAPAIAWFYHEPRLIAITLALSGAFLFGGLTAQHYALLTRQMRFGAMSLVVLLPLLACNIVGVGLAKLGYGYWSLVVMSLVLAVGTALAAWIAAGWIPGWPRRGCGIRSMLAFGGHLTGFNLLNYLTRNGDNILIGRFLGAGSLGIYSKAYGLLMLPVQQINAPINGVVLPALSRLQNQPEQYRRYFLRAVEGLAFVGMPIIAFAFADAEPIVSVFLGSKWMAAVGIFRLLAPAALVGTINLAPVWIFTTLGRADRQLRWAVITSPMILAGFLIGLHWGAAGVAASFSITFGVSFTLFVLDACRHSPIQVRDFGVALFPPLCVSIAAAAIVSLIGLPSHYPAAMRLGADIAIFALAFVSLSLIFPGGRRVWKLFLIQIKFPRANMRNAANRESKD